MSAYTVVLRRIDHQGPPSATDVEEFLVRLQRELSADMLELRLLGGVETNLGIFEICAGIHHGMIQPQRIKFVRNIIVKMNGISIFCLRMRFDSWRVSRSEHVL